MEEKKTELERFKNQLRESDSDTLSQRALNLQKLDSLKISKLVRTPTLRVLDYASEAERSYINGCYRSCIFCSSNAVEQSFIHLLIAHSEDWERTYSEIENRKMTFGKVLKEATKRKMKSLTRFEKDADWLRRVRNEIVAHPTFIADYFELESPDQIIWANKIMFKDIRELLQFFNAPKRKQLEMEKLTAKTPDGKKVGESEPLKEFLKHPTKIEVATYFNWWAFQTGLLAYLALEAYERMIRILNGLYGRAHKSQKE